MRTRSALVAALLLLTGCSSGPQEAPSPEERGGTDVSFVVLDKTTNSHHVTPAPTLVVVRTERAWRQLWASHVGGARPRPALPTVDFAVSTVLAYFDGGSLGPVEPTTVRLGTGSSAVLTVRKVDTSGCPHTEALENPAVIIRVPAIITTADVDRQVVLSPCT